MAILFKNNAASTLTYKMTDVQEVLYVADASVFPVITPDSGDVFKLTLVGDDTLEIVEAFEVYNPEGRQGFKIRRAQEGTTAQAWPAGTRVVIYRKSDNAVVFSKETGIDATTCVIPANTLAHHTEYHCRIDNWFVEGGQLDAEDMTKFTSKTAGFVTSYPAVWQAYRSSTTYSVPYTGTYDVVAIGGGGSGGTGYSRFDSSNPPMFVTYVNSGAGGGSGGISRWQGTINAGTALTCTVGAGGAGYPTSQCQGNSSVGDAPGGGACSAYGGYIAGGGGAGALGSLIEPAEWATPGWTNDSYTHPANAGAGQVGCVLIISTWAL